MAEMATSSKQANKKQFYILLLERTGQKVDKAYASVPTDTKKFVSLGKGEILESKTCEKTPDPLAQQRFKVIDRSSVYVECCRDEVKKIDEEEALLLLPVSSLSDRLQLLEERKHLEYGKKLKKGDYVYVIMGPRLQTVKQPYEGIIRYKGPLQPSLGTQFGVEIVGAAGRGSTNGFFRGTQYFECSTDSAVFVSLEKLKFHRNSKKTKVDIKNINGCDENNSGIIDMVVAGKNKVVAGITHLISGEKPDETASFEHYDGHKLDDRVWVYIMDRPCCGIIKYIGKIPQHGEHVFAGIMLDHPFGQGNGECYGKQLFLCEMRHANFTPIDKVISKEKFSEFFEGTTDGAIPKVSDIKDNSVPQTSEDILDMESRFSKQSGDQIKKEQENILKKIQQEKEQKMAAGKKAVEYRSSNGTTTHDKQWYSTNEVQSKSHFSHATFPNNAHVEDTRRPLSTNSQQMPNFSLQSNLELGSMVEVLSKHQKPKYGVIRWLGFVPNSDKKIAGLELEEEMEACTDGIFLGKRYFNCPSRRGFFVHLHNCKPDSRFRGNSLENSGSQRLTGTEFGDFCSPIVDHELIPPPKTIKIYLKQEGAGKEEAKGIQGHHNSCYLDATLFAAFAFSSVMDSILLRPQNKNDIEEYEKVQTVLRNKIVYPLRSCGFVRADRVLELRQLLDRLGTVTGLVGEEKDPEEFLTTLLEQVLKTEPFIKVKSGKEVNPAYFYQVLADKDSERVLPSVEELLKKSFHQTEVKLTELPSCLLVQMPRFGKGFKMYKRILPSLTINIGQLVENYPQDCAVCGRLAKHYCTECFRSSIDVDCSGNYCMDCNKRVHSNVKRNKHNVKPIAVSRPVSSSFGDRPVEHHEMELFAVICIETSHYVTFAKCEEPDGTVKWCFFDSMADRVGAQNGYNVPAVIECPEVIEWLSAEKENRQRIINTDDKDMPDRVRRLLGDAYVCLYASKEMAMYK